MNSRLASSAAVCIAARVMSKPFVRLRRGRWRRSETYDQSPMGTVTPKRDAWSDPDGAAPTEAQWLSRRKEPLPHPNSGNNDDSCHLCQNLDFRVSVFPLSGLSASQDIPLSKRISLTQLRHVVYIDMDIILYCAFAANRKRVTSMSQWESYQRFNCSFIQIANNPNSGENDAIRHYFQKNPPLQNVYEAAESHRA
jgi:hypothetical protein